MESHVFRSRRGLRSPYLFALVALALVALFPADAEAYSETFGYFTSEAEARAHCESWNAPVSGFDPDADCDGGRSSGTSGGVDWTQIEADWDCDFYGSCENKVNWRWVDSCPDGTEPDSTGLCTEPEPFEPPTEPITNMNGPKGAQNACFDGAEYESVGVGVSLGDDSEMLSNWEPTGNQCSEGQPQMMPNDNPADPGCVTGDSGMEVCDGDPGFNEQCGTFNGEYVCKSALPNGGACMVGEGDTNTCANNGVTAVTPQFDPATENFEVTSGPETMHMIDNSTGDVTNMTVQQGTVSQGSHGLTDPVPDQAGDGDGGDGDGSGEDEGSGICDEAPKLCGDEDGGGEFVGPETGDAPTVEDSTDSYWGRIQEAPILAALDDVGTQVPAGVCPGLSITTEYLGTLATDKHCDLITNPKVADVLRLVMLLGWSWMGVTIVLRA